MATVTLSPKYRSRDDKARAPARLATTMLEVVVAGAADAARFQRGRAYVNDGAVVTLHVSTGRLEAEVAGSRSSEYEVTVNVVLAGGRPTDTTNSPASLIPLVPEPDDLRYSCTCPDQSGLCKHTVAAMLAFAAEVGDRPDLLRLWRVGPTERAKVGGLKSVPDPTAVPTAPAAPPVPLWETAEWQEYLGTTTAIADAYSAATAAREPLQPLPPEQPELVGQVDAAALVDSARRTLAQFLERVRRH
jgi:hypothetical protein